MKLWAVWWWMACSMSLAPDGAEFDDVSDAIANPDLPGLEATPGLVGRLEHAQHASGASNRVHHLASDGSPRFTNRLILETSPYLRQHAHNPVSWFPWGDAAFERARELGKPILLSVGYATCARCVPTDSHQHQEQVT